MHYDNYNETSKNNESLDQLPVNKSLYYNPKNDSKSHKRSKTFEKNLTQSYL